MTLEKKSLIGIGLTVASVIVVLYFASRIIMLGGFAKLEEQNTVQNVKRVQEAITEDLATLNATAGDWASWDDTYAFIQDGNDDYINNNLKDATFANLKLNLMLFINSTGRIIYGKGYDLSTEKEVTVPASLDKQITPGSPLLQHLNTESSGTGVVLLPEGPVLVASRPILTSGRMGPIRGTLVIGRYLNSAEIKRLAQRTHVSFTIQRLNDPQRPFDVRLALPLLSKKTPVQVRAQNLNTVAGYALLPDIFGKPCLVVKVSLPRDIYKHGLASVHLFLLALLVGGFVFCVVVGLLYKVLEQARRKRWESEERFRTLVNSMDDILFTLNRELICDGVFGPWVHKLGLNQQFFVGKTLPEVFGPDAADIHVAAVGKALAGENVVYEWFSETPVGIKHVQASLSPIHNSKGEITGIVGVGRDITGHRRAEEALRHQLEFQNIIADICSNFVHLPTEEMDSAINVALQSIGQFIGADRGYVFQLSSNKIEMVKMLEWCAEGVEPRVGSLSRFPVAAFPWWMGKLNRWEPINVPDVASLPQEASAEKELLQSQAVRSLLVQPMTDAKQLLGFIGFDMLRERKNWNEQAITLLRIVAEKTLHALERRRAEYRWRLEASVFENVSEGILVINTEAIIQSVNPAFSTITEYAEADVVGDHLFSLASGGPKIIGYELMLASLNESGHWQGEVLIRRKSGGVFPAWWSASAIRDEHGHVSQYVNVINDFTEQVKLREERQLLHEQTARAQRLASLSTMSAGIAHEINQPLNAIKLIADGAMYWYQKGRSPEPEKLMENLQRVSAQARRIEGIIKHIRLFTNAGQARALFPCNLNEAVHGAMGIVGSQMAAHDISVNMALAEELPQVRANSSRLEEVVINLLVNARQALDAVSYPQKEITCTTWFENGKAILEISDNATGVPDENKNKIFEPFFSTKKSEEGGMGLGLPLVQSIIASFKGQIDVRNNDKGGATFRVELPALESNDLG